MSAGLAIIMARYYKPMWPNNRICGERVWFAVSTNFKLIFKRDVRFYKTFDFVFRSINLKIKNLRLKLSIYSQSD